MLPSPTKLKRKLDTAVKHCGVVEKKLKNARERERTAKETCYTISAKLRELNIINDELKLKLDSYSDITNKPSLSFCRVRKLR